MVRKLYFTQNVYFKQGGILRASKRFEELKFVAMAIWFGVKAALTFGVPLLVGWFSIPFFQSLGISLRGTYIEFFLPFIMIFVWVIGAPSVGALLCWVLWGINPFKGVETKQKKKPHR